MMGVSVADARGLTFHEYTAMLDIWNVRHADKDGKGAPAEAPDIEKVRRNMARLNAAQRPAAGAH